MDELELQEKFEDFLEDYQEYKNKMLLNVQGGNFSLTVDFMDLARHNPKVADFIIENPEFSLDCLNAYYKKNHDIERMRIRFINIPKDCEYPISNIRSKQLGKLVKLKGLVKQKSKAMPEKIKGYYECKVCGESQTATDKKPYMCSCGAKGQFFEKEVIYSDFQVVKIEEPADEIESGERPQDANIVLRDDLTSDFQSKKMKPGTNVFVVCIPKPMEIQSKNKSPIPNADFLYEGIAIEPSEEEDFELDISTEDKKKIKDFSKKRDLFKKLISYIAPMIYGYLEEKEAILLQMAGGKKIGPKRAEIHILIVGDPGTGKTRLGQAVKDLMYKSRYLSGKGSTGTGMTATVVRNEITGNWALEAGAMVLASGSILIADEIEKMDKDDISNLHEALSVGTVSISKANIQASLKSQTSLLAIANPVMGRFDNYKTIHEQINLSPTLLSRFDLIFIAKDTLSEKEDDELTDFMLYDEDIPQPSKEEYVFFRKYIHYAKKITPTFSKSALEEIGKFYKDLRRKSREEQSGTIAIGRRQLDALKRLAVASAKIRLSKIVKVEDSQRAIKLVQHYLKSVGMDLDTGKIDIDRIESTIPSKKRDKLIKVIEFVKQHIEVSEEDIVEAMAGFGMNEFEVNEYLRILRNNGEVLEPTRGVYKAI